MATAASPDLWGLTWGQPYIDPAELAAAVEEQVQHENLDFRTRLLIRDSLNALARYWGPGRWDPWLAASSERGRLTAILDEEFGEIGFPSLGSRLMEKLDPEVVNKYLRAVGARLHRPVKLLVGGSIAVIAPGLLNRTTEDIDVVDEVPEEVRKLHTLLAQLQSQYGLHLGHFQSHYLPKGWRDRLHYHDKFGQLEVFLVDVYDVFLSKLFSDREKDLKDLDVLKPKLDKDRLTRLLCDETKPLLETERYRKLAETNWYILFGESLPHDADPATGPRPA